MCERTHQKSHRKRQRQSSKKGQRGREVRDAKRYKEVRVYSMITLPMVNESRFKKAVLGALTIKHG